MKILVTGAAGFIGSYLVKRLALNSKPEILAVDNNFRYGFDHLEKLRLPNVRIVPADIGKKKEIEKIFKKNINNVIHLAANPGKRFCEEYPEATVKNNIYGTYLLLEESIKSHVDFFLFTSSYEVYGEPKYLPVDESHPIQPSSLYSFTKAACEQLIGMYAANSLPTTILRLAPVYGYGLFTRWNEVIGKFVTYAFNEGALPIHKPPNLSEAGEQVIDLVHVKDVADSIISVIKNREICEDGIYNISNGKGISIREIADIVRQIAKEKMNKELKIKEISANNIISPKIIISNRRINDQIAWKPRITLEEGVKSLFSNYPKTESVSIK